MASCFICAVALVRLCACLLVTSMSPAKTTGPIEMPFRLWAQVGSRNHVLGRGLDPLREGAVFFILHVPAHCKV